MIESIAELHAREVGLRSLMEAIDTATPAGRLQFHIFGALAEFERASGPARAWPLRGLAVDFGGRPASLSPEKLAAAEAMRAHHHPMRDIAAALGVSRATLYRHLSAGDA